MGEPATLGSSVVEVGRVMKQPGVLIFCKRSGERNIADLIGGKVDGSAFSLSQAQRRAHQSLTERSRLYSQR